VEANEVTVLADRVGVAPKRADVGVGMGAGD